MKRRSLTRLLAGVLGLAFLAAGWLFLGPTQVGGTTSYAVIFGSSMEPSLRRGDLAVIRSQSTYRPGDVVLYDSPQLSSKVLHRIVRVEGDRFVLKGDNNDFLDSEQPTEEQIVGRLWLSVPAVGHVSEWLREPAHSALLVGLATLLALGGGVGVGAARRRRRGSAAREEAPRETRPSGAGGGDPQPLLVGIGVALAAFGLLALLAFTRPTTAVETIPDAYAHQGRFAYEGVVRPNAVYPDGRVSTGEPLFLRLVPRLRVSFDYQLESRLPAEAAGNVSLAARVSDGRGWERTLPLAPARPFAGRSVSTSGTLDLRRVQALIDRLRDLTGSAQSVYTVVVVPRVTVKGSVGGEPLDAVFAPALAFEFGDLRLQPKLDGSGEGVGPFARREPGTGTRATANRVELGALSLPVTTARRLSLIGLVASALLGLLGLALLLQRFRGEEQARIAARYGHLLLPVVSRPQEWARVTELADIESLVRLAHHHDRMILRVVDGDEHAYVVEEGGSVYRYRTLPRPAGPLPPVVPPRPPAPPRTAEDTAEGALVGGGKRRGPRRRFGRRRNHDDW